MEQQQRNNTKLVKDQSNYYKTKKDWIDEKIRPYYSKPVDLTYTASDFDKILRMTADMSNIPLRDVEYMIDHTWTYISDWVKNPHTCSVLLINEFGSFTLNLKSLNIQIKRLIPFLRGKDRDKYIGKFRELWRRRQLAIVMENRKKKYNRKFYFSKSALKNNN